MALAEMTEGDALEAYGAPHNQAGGAMGIAGAKSKEKSTSTAKKADWLSTVDGQELALPAWGEGLPED